MLNLIIILIDGGRLDRAENSKVFQSIKQESVSFSQSITYAPYTTAAMHAVFSGCYGNRNGTDSYWHTYDFKKEKFKTITEYLSEHEFYTFADAHTDLIIPEQGFDEFNIHDEENINITKWHSEILDMMKKKYQEGKNFFVYLHYSKIHTGIMNQVLKKIDNFNKDYFQNRVKNEKRYDELFNESEKYLESILKKINDCGFNENSLIVIMSDHGISTGEKFGEKAYGAFCYDYTLKTITYLKAKDLIPKIIEQQISHVDIMPTILEYLGIDFDTNYEELDGKSLLPLINGIKIDEKIAYSETGNPLREKMPPKSPNTKSVRTSEWKLIINEYNATKELSNLKNDPSEEKNLIGTNLEVENYLLKEFTKIQNKSI